MTCKGLWTQVHEVLKQNARIATQCMAEFGEQLPEEVAVP